MSRESRHVYTFIGKQFADGTSIHMSGRYTDVRDGYSAAAVFLLPAGNVRIGPEARVTGNRNYWQVKAGPVISGLKVSKISFSISGGVSFKNDGAESAYMGLSAGTAF